MTAVHRHNRHRHHHRDPRPPSNLKATLTQRKQGRATLTTATLTWTDPTTRVDGTALAPNEVASIDIFDTASPGAAIGNVPGGAQKFTTGTLSVGDHSFTAVANDTSGHKSAPSGAATVTVLPTLAAPNPPSGLTATLNP
jgi:hypothetical protein